MATKNTTSGPYVYPWLHRVILWIVAISSSVLSAALTITLCLHLGHAKERWFSVGIGVVFELGKMAFFVTGMRILLHRKDWMRWVGVFPCLLGVALVCASLCASVGYFAHTDTQDTVRSLHASERYQDLVSQISDTDQHIAMLLKSASADVSEKYRTRGLKTSEKVFQLREAREKLSEKLALLEQHPTRSDFFNAQNPVTKMRLFGALALLLELIGIMAPLLLQLPSSHATDATEETLKPHKNATVALKTHVPVTHATAPLLHATAFERAKLLIATGEVTPTTRDLRKTLRISQERTRSLLNDLVNQQVLIKQGNRFVRVVV